MIRTPVALAAALLLLGASPAPARAAEAQAPGCDVESATLTWGFKESFRGYIDGSIANGEWTVADGATYATPDFGFTATTGRVDPRDPNGGVDFAGSVRFTGHGGILDTTVAHPVLVLRPTGDALLLLDVSGPTMEGGEVAVTATPFVAIDLTGQDLTPDAGVITIDAAPTTLTADGEAAFPNYPAGEAFDPITVTMDVGDCDLTGQPIGTDVVETSEPGWLLGLIGLGVVAVSGAVGYLVVRALRRPRSGR